MKEQEWNFVDKSEWEQGPWMDEPDKRQWLDPETGLPCLIHRGPSGALCGYVGVSKGHPWYEQDYDACRVPENEDGDTYVEVHGGLTFASKCGPTKENGRGICHVVEQGEADDVWWLGFDCAHSGDLCPSRQRDRGWDYCESYKDFRYVELEVKRLAKQAASAQ